MLRHVLLLSALLVPAASSAQGVSAVRPLPGYACMMLNLSNDAMRNPANLPPVLQAPSATAQRLGTASTVVIVSSPQQTMNGFVRVLHLDGRPGWIDATKLRPWRSASDPNATCTPSLMSNGRPGFR